MKTFAFVILAVVSFAAMVWSEEVHDLKIGEAAPEFSLPGIDGKTHALAEYKDPKVLMILFTSNHCPTSHAAEARIKKLIADMKGKSFAIVAINPNHPDGLSIDELGFSKYNDGFEDMAPYAKEAGFDFPYLYDGETQKVAKAYGCLATPHVFIFDSDRKLRYKGHFDDSQFEDYATVKVHGARNAVEALLAGEPVPVEITKPLGCSTKWISKKTGIAEQTAKWDGTPVVVETIDAAGIAALRKNGTKKLRLFNVWATTCGPCVAEFPELVKTSRKFDMREFELITISTDDVKDSPKVQAFLEKKNAGLSNNRMSSLKAEGRKTNHYIFKGSANDLMKELDSEWPGPIPHSLLVGTKGEVVWRHNGPVDGEELRDKVLGVLGDVFRP